MELGVVTMPYIAKHKRTCKDKSRYIVIKRVMEIEDSKGRTLDNSDPGTIMYMRCADCLAPAKKLYSTNISVGKKTRKLSIPDKPVKCKNIST
jgi:hypothetical protein